MKANKKQVNRIFKDMKVEPVKEWRMTTCNFAHKDKKKQANKKACRKGALWYG
jgi:hypothetical protein